MVSGLMTKQVKLFIHQNNQQFVRNQNNKYQRRFCCGNEDLLITWLQDQGCVGVPSDSIAVRKVGGHGQRGLVAKQLIEPEKVIFSLPLDMIMMENVQNLSELPNLHGEFPWSVDMGMQLLQIKKQCQKEDKNCKTKCEWLNSLPKQVLLPSIYFSEQEILEFDYDDIIQEIYVIKQMHEQSYEVLQTQLQSMNFGWEDFQWACSVMLSRCFIFGEDERHISVPGVDMCNHSFNAKAYVRIIHNPEQCQGQDATLEIAPPNSSNNESKSYFQLQTGEHPVKSGREINICYGEWANDAFVLFFGFIPEYNPYDQCILFYTFHEVLEFVLWLATKKQFQLDQQGEELLQDIIHTIQQGCQNDLGGWQRLCVYTNGMDDGLIQSIRAIASRWKKITQKLLNNGFKDIKSPSLGEIIKEKCLYKLESFKTSIEEDMSLLQSSYLSDNYRLAVKFRASKKQVLLAALRNLNEPKQS